MADGDARELSIEEVTLILDERDLGFETTDELDPLDDLTAQPRAARAMELGLAVRSAGYNVYVAGQRGMGRKRLVLRALRERAAQEPTPPDWAYVHDFHCPDRPLALKLPPGGALRLRDRVDALLEHLQRDLPRAFEHEEVRLERHQLVEELEAQERAITRELEALAQRRELGLARLPGGQMAVTPLQRGRPMPEVGLTRLSDEERESVRRRQHRFAEDAAPLLARQHELHRQLRSRMEQADRRIAARLVQPLVDEIRDEWEDEKVRAWLASLGGHVIEHWQRFVDAQEDGQHSLEALLGAVGAEDAAFREYRVNVLVDNGDTDGAPVVVEDAPNYKNLFGIVEHGADRMGRTTTDFTRIKGGSLLRASGGFLVFDLLDAIAEPVVWKELKRAMKSGTLRIEDYEPLGLFSRSGLKPEPIPLDVKLVVLGSPLAYHLLHRVDEDFPEMFKVKAELRPDLDRGDGGALVVGRLLQAMSRDGEGLLPFSAGGVAELTLAAVRLAGDRNKVSAEMNRLSDVAREASFWAGRGGSGRVERDHVRIALEERVYRSDLVAERIRELVRNGTLRIDLSGTAVGQVHGVAVVDLGDHAFGRPIRVSASVGVGSGGIINVERESKLSGRTHDKGVLILEGFLRHAYGRERPLALSASLAMEQSYGPIEGDSASVAELLCLVGALADVELRQDVVVTGSVDQRGCVQAVGGVTEKVEGVYEICRADGLTGTQGVVVPSSNQNNLVLRPEVATAVRDGRFHVWAVDHVDQVLALLADMPARDVHARAEQRLDQLAEVLRKRQAFPTGDGRSSVPPRARQPEDPRPPLPIEAEE